MKKNNHWESDDKKKKKTLREDSLQQWLSTSGCGLKWGHRGEKYKVWKMKIKKKKKK